MTDIAAVRASNITRLNALAQTGIRLPLDQLYLRSLIEYLLGDELEMARQFHEERLRDTLNDAERQVEEARKLHAQQQARATLLNGVGHAR